jgi:hypothetical protein
MRSLNIFTEYFGKRRRYDDKQKNNEQKGGKHSIVRSPYGVALRLSEKSGKIGCGA